MKASSPARATVYFKPKVFRALKVQAALAERSVSDLVNEAVLHALREETIDAETVRHRAKEPTRPFDEVIADLKRDGLL